MMRKEDITPNEAMLRFLEGGKVRSAIAKAEKDGVWGGRSFLEVLIGNLSPLDQRKKKKRPPSGKVKPQS